jgi:two-component system, LytTR family, sensor kinase
MTEATRGRLIRWRGIAALWCAGALFDACQTVLFMHALGKQQTWLIFGTELVSWVPWALATPIVVKLARQRPLSLSAPVGAAIAHLAAFTAISLVAEAWFAMLQMLFNPWDYLQRPTFMDSSRISLAYQIPTFLIVYALILAITYVIDSRERMARQMTETARLNEELSRAQLGALRRQMEPHFMFNTLNSIAGLVRDQKNDDAVSMIVGVSEFLRRATENSQRPQVTLAEEVEYLQRYLDIQKVRFGDRLKIIMDIPEELLRTPVPNLLLQPLVENAIKHGISKRVEGGTVRVAGTRDKGSLRISVYNVGPCLPSDWRPTHTGVGIGNLRTRLRILHGEDSDLQLRRVDTGGVEVIVTLPFAEG